MTKKIVVACILFINSFLFAEQYVAVVNGITINAKAFDAIYKDSLRDYNRYRLLSKQESLDEKENNTLKSSVLDFLVENSIIANFATKEKINITDQEVQERISVLQRGFQTKEDFWRTLKAQDIKFDKMVQNIKDHLLKDKIVGKVFPDYEIIITDDIIGYLKKNNLYMFPVQYNITLLVSNNYQYIEKLIKSDSPLRDWDKLALDKNRSYQSLVILEEDLPNQFAELISSININTFSPVKKYSKSEYFSFRINQIVNMPAFDFNLISKSVKDSLVEEKKTQYYNSWVKKQKEQSIIKVNREIVPLYNPNENEEELFMEQNMDITVEDDPSILGRII